MTTFTRDKLQQLYAISIKESSEKKIQEYVNIIKEKILNSNCKGDKSHTYYFYKNFNKENGIIINEIARRIQEIFIDSEVIFKKSDTYEDDRIFIDWTN